MKSDIEIAQAAELYPITEVAKALDLTIDDLELYGKYKAKISEDYLKKTEKNQEGLVRVLALRAARQAAEWRRLFPWRN